MKKKFRLEETEWAAGESTVSIKSSVSYIMFYYTFTTPMSQNTDLLSGLEKAPSDGVSRVWPVTHSEGIVTKEVRVKQMMLYTSPMRPEYLGQDFTWWKAAVTESPVGGACCPESGAGSHLLAHRPAWARHGALGPCSPAWIRLCRHMLSPYLTSPQHHGSSSSRVCIPSAPLPLLTFAGQAGFGLQTRLPLSLLLSRQHGTRHAAPQPLRLALVWGWFKLRCQS